MIRENWDSVTYPNSPTHDSLKTANKAHSCDFLPCVDHNTGELTTVGEWALSLSDAGRGGLISLEQVTVSNCTAPNRPHLVARNSSTKSAVFFRPRCKLWSCKFCAKVNSDLWQMRVTFGCQQFIEQGHELSFVTFTSHEKLSAQQTLKVLPHSWHKLSMRLRRKVKGLKYVVIPERHHDERVHIHGIFLAGASKRWWKDNARSCGMGYQAEENAVYSPSGAGFYIGKYLAKQLSDARWAKGFRRVRTSLHFPKLPTLDRHPDWVFEPVPATDSLGDATKFLSARGWRVALADHATAWALLDKLSELT